MDHRPVSEHTALTIASSKPLMAPRAALVGGALACLCASLGLLFPSATQVFTVAALLFGLLATLGGFCALHAARRFDHSRGDRSFAEVTLQSISDAVIATDATGTVNYLNRSAESLTGWPRSEALGRPLGEVFQIMCGSERGLIRNPAENTLSHGAPSLYEGNAVLLVRNGRPLPVDASVSAIRYDRSGDSGNIIGAVVAFRDVERERKLSNKLAYQARHDALTGLYNRNEFEYRLNLLYQSARHQERAHTLLYIDLDQFKVVNDSCGHLAGDALLKQLTSLLQHEVRKRDTLARLGGDEFGVLLERCSGEDAMRIANTLLYTIQNFRFRWKDKTFNVGASIGLVGINNHSEGVTQLLAAADSACYAAKDAGRNRIRAYSDEDAQLSLRDGELQWISRLTHALEENQLQLYFQRIQPISPTGDEGAYYEVLLRLFGEGQELISAAAFLPAAERYNMMARIDRWVLASTLDCLQDNPAHLDQLALCSINVSGHSVGDKQFLGYVIEQLRSHAVPAEKICFEITETAVIANMGQAVDFINTLRELGCCFALDDFGSGLSSFAYLKDLPVDILKIDGMFVKDVLDDPIHAALIRSISEIGHIMGKRVVAEYVCEPEILDILRACKIDYAQGNALHKPERLETLLQPQPAALDAS